MGQVLDPEKETRGRIIEPKRGLAGSTVKGEDCSINPEAPFAHCAVGRVGSALPTWIHPGAAVGKRTGGRLLSG